MCTSLTNPSFPGDCEVAKSIQNCENVTLRKIVRNEFLGDIFQGPSSGQEERRKVPSFWHSLDQILRPIQAGLEWLKVA